MSDRFRRLLAGLADDLRLLDARIVDLNDEIASIADADPAVQQQPV